MALKIWLLVQWLTESVIPEYGVRFLKEKEYDEKDIKLDTIIFLRTENETPRPAKILRISGSKKYIDEQKEILDRENRNVNDAVTTCMQRIVDVASKKRSLRFPMRAEVVPYGANSEIIKVFKDVETQTVNREVEANVYPLLKKLIRNVADFMKNWDKNILNKSNTNNSPYHEEESHNEHNADVGAEEVIVACDENQTLNSSIRETEENVYHNDPRVRTAHTTHDDDEDLVTIGKGKTPVSRRLLQEIDWNSYTTATRQLLQGIFPRKVLATSCLTGKKSPAFLNKPAKKLLDPVKVDDIVTTVSKKCGVPRNLVRSSITIKCTDEAKLHRKRQQDKLTRMALHHNNENNPTTTSLSDKTVAPDEAHRNRQQGTHSRVSLHQNDENISPPTPSTNETGAPPEVNLHRNRQQGMRTRMSLLQNEVTTPPSTSSSIETVAPPEVNLHRNRQQGMRTRMSLHQNEVNTPPSTSSCNETVASHEVKLYRNRQQSKRPRSRMSLHQNDENIPPTTTLSDETVAPHEEKIHRNRPQGKCPRMSLHQNDEKIPPTTLSDETVAPHEAKINRNRPQGKCPLMSLHQNDEKIPPKPSSDDTVIQIKHPPNMTMYQNEKNIPPLTPPSDDIVANLCK